jgi:hypothetical protein
VASFLTVRFTGDETHEALAAQAVAGAGGVNGDIVLLCQIEDVVAVRSSNDTGGAALDGECDIRHLSIPF